MLNYLKEFNIFWFFQSSNLVRYTGNYVAIAVLVSAFSVVFNPILMLFAILGLLIAYGFGKVKM